MIFESRKPTLVLRLAPSQALSWASLRPKSDCRVQVTGAWKGRANRLAYNVDHENIDLVAYLREVAKDLKDAVAPCRILLDVPKDDIQFAADRAILIALTVNELISNAGRHAYPDSVDGIIRLQIVANDDNVVISVSDEGVGLPADFNPDLTKRLGTRII